MRSSFDAKRFGAGFHPASRSIFPTSPPQVEYSLTALGRSMSEPVLAFGEWVRGHLAEFDAARRRFDDRDGKIERLAG